MRVNFNLEFSLYGHLSATRIIILPCLANVFLFWIGVPLGSIMEFSRVRNITYDSHINLSNSMLCMIMNLKYLENHTKIWTARMVEVGIFNPYQRKPSV